MGHRPVMIVHGVADFVMPRDHAQRLYEAAHGPRTLWFGPGPHSNIATQAPSEYAKRLFAFLEENLPDDSMRSRPGQSSAGGADSSLHIVEQDGGDGSENEDGQPGGQRGRK